MDIWEDGFQEVDVIQMNSSTTWLNLWRTTQDLKISCTLVVERTHDGIGGSFLRWFWSVILAGGLGCQSVIPAVMEHTEVAQEDRLVLEESLASFNAQQGRGAVWRNGTLYCHRTVVVGLSNPEDTSYENLSSVFRCVVSDWEEFFNIRAYAVEAVPKPEEIVDLEVFEEWLRSMKEHPGAKPKVNVMCLPKEPINAVLRGQPWRNGLDPAVALPSTILAGRDRIRDAFHAPRPGYHPYDGCEFPYARLNVAIQLRQGDYVRKTAPPRRRELKKCDMTRDQTVEGFDMDVGALVSRIAAAAEELDREPPRVHVYSESREPCPNQLGYFREFPHLHISHEQVAACLAAKPPEHCQEREMGGVCNRPEAHFFVSSQGKNYDTVLHLNGRENTAIRCMANADVIISATSSFGQLPAFLSRGLKIFCPSCGRGCNPFGKILPLIALADGGRSWFPVNRDDRSPIVSAKLAEQLANVYAANGHLA